MTETIKTILEPIQNRLNAASDGPWVTALSGDRKWALVLKDAGTADEWIVAKSNDDDNAEFIANAPTDQARLLAAVQAVLGEIADTDLETDEALQGDLSDRILAAIESALTEAR